MQQHKTHPDIIEVIIENLMAWHDGRPPVLYNGSLPFLARSITSQTALGWNSFLRGFVSTQWSKAQQLHLLHIGSRKSGKRWLIELIKNSGRYPGTCGGSEMGFFTRKLLLLPPISPSCSPPPLSLS